MRVIAGRFKGRRLAPVDAPHIRPTTDQVKGSIFNRLQGHFPGPRVLDLFAGTGNLGIEALSRGASAVVFVEKHRASVRVLEKNLALLGDLETETQVVVLDVFKFIADYSGRPFDILLIDPPFTEKIAHTVLESLSGSAVLAPGTIVVIEAGRHERLDTEYPGFVTLDVRTFGDKHLALFAWQGEK